MISKFNPNMVRDCAFLTSPKETIGFELPVDGLTSKQRKNRVGSVSSITCGSKIKTKSFMANFTTTAVTEMSKRHDNMVLTTNRASYDSLETTKMIRRTKNQTKSFKPVTNISVEIECNSVKPISSMPQPKVTKSSGVISKLHQQTGKKKILAPKPNISAMMPKSLYCDLSIESVNQVIAQSQPNIYNESDGSVGDVEVSSCYDTPLQPATEFSFTKTLHGDQLHQVQLLDKQISRLQLAASRYCHTARKLLQKRVRGFAPGALPTNSGTATTSLGEIMGSDVFELRASIEQVLQSVHAVIDDLKEKKKRILMQGTSSTQSANIEIDSSSELLHWRKNNSTQSLNCNTISEETMRHIHHILAEDDRVCSLRSKVRSGLHNFALRVREGSFPLVADTGYVNNYVDSYKDWDAQDKTENDALIIF
jgi:hypothetical protein